ncbi:hypothetical protein EDC96DRAFT_171232 [Choanephora cucurbitarum]|nr:hypothetical protein EDC96DRAFT_171232 [Choanephora cucurbitarum]
MYSPRRTKIDDYEGLPERVIASPLRAIASPIYQAVKQCKDTVTRDFDRFYDNLQSRLSPRTSDARIRKRTSETTDRTRYHLKQKRSDIEDRNRTSLTPLIERHSLREDNKRNNYSTHNPFFQDMESDVAETPSLVEFDMDDTPSTYYTTNRKTSMSTSRLQQQLVEERQRMDRLQKNLSRIKRQSSFLAEELSSAMSMEDHEERLLSEDMIMKTPSRATTEESRSLDERPLFDSKRTGSIDQRITAFETPLSKQFSVARESPVSIRQTPRKPSSNTPKKSPITPSMNKQKKSPMYSTSPKRNIIEEISTSKLRSTETIR